MSTIRQTAEALAGGRVTARSLVEDGLDRIHEPAGEGSRAFLRVADDQARAVADGIDAIRAAGGRLPPYAGLPIAIKDLCDIEGEVTTAGSKVLADRPPAETDAPVIRRLRRAGFVFMGRTNMTEFAYSGLGLNAHFDTPRSPWDRDTGRIPGGSSSGSAVAVADGMAAVALGTDTGGSCRIPAAFCGIVGYKPTAARVPLDGLVPLSPSLDSVGPLGRSVDCCAVVDDILVGGDGRPSTDARPPERMRLAVLRDYMFDDAAPEVLAVFDQALSLLSAGGVQLTDVSFPELNELPTINRQGGLATAEAYHWHRPLLAEHGDAYDQRIRSRIEPGEKISAAGYLDVLDARRRMIAVAADRLAGFDAFVMPTVAITAPTVASFDSDDPAYYTATNLLCLRNTLVANFLDGCSITIPASPPGEAGVGVMLMAGPHADHQLFSLARTVESLLDLPDRD